MFPEVKDKFPSVSEFNMFRYSGENKTRVPNLLKNELFGVASSISKELIYLCRKFVWNLSGNEEKFEADTIMFSIYYSIGSIDKDTMAATDATDTDCYAQWPLSTKSGQNHSANLSGELVWSQQWVLWPCKEFNLW